MLSLRPILPSLLATLACFTSSLPPISGYAQDGVEDKVTGEATNTQAADLKGDERIWGLILHAQTQTETVAAPPVDEKFHAKALSGLMGRVKKALPAYKGFKVVGAHDQKVLKEYSTWITPSQEFPLRVDAKGRSKEGDGINIYLQLWDKVGAKEGKVLVKTDAILKRSSPLIIEGPKWRKGRIIFVLMLEYSELLKKRT